MRSRLRRTAVSLGEYVPQNGRIRPYGTRQEGT
jgi:hypothetical protein